MSGLRKVVIMFRNDLFDKIVLQKGDTFFLFLILQNGLYRYRIKVVIGIPTLIKTSKRI